MTGRHQPLNGAGALPASEWCDRHHGWVDEGRTRPGPNGLGRVCDGCRELRSPKPLPRYPEPDPDADEA